MLMDEYAKYKRRKRTQYSNVKGVWFEKKYKRMYPYNTSGM